MSLLSEPGGDRNAKEESSKEKKAGEVTRDPELQPLTPLVKLFHRLCRRNKPPPFETDQRVPLCDIHSSIVAELGIWKECVGFTQELRNL